MNALKSVFNFLGRFLTSARIVVTNLITFIFLALVFIGLISVFIPNDRSIDKEGKVVILNPEGVLVDQEVHLLIHQDTFRVQDDYFSFFINTPIVGDKNRD